jgi:ABC-type phosphate transport system substrate-binding protein
MKTLHRILRAALLVGLLAPALAAAADFVVIVNASNKATSVKKGELQRYFLRTASAWPDGEACRPVDQARSSPVRAAFSKEVLEKSMAAVDQFWTHSVFSGRAVPPPERKTEREVLEYVRENPGAVGYVSAGASLDGVRKVAVAD